MNTGNGLNAASPVISSLFRVVVSLLFACHGAATVLGAFGGPAGGRPAAGAWPSWWAGLIQLVGGVLVLLGVGEIGTRIAATFNSGSMAYAYFTVHQKHALWPIQNGGELAVLFCWSFLLIAITGCGAWSLAGALRKPISASGASLTPHGTSPGPGTETT